jgi:hypothetical protein
VRLVHGHPSPGPSAYEVVAAWVPYLEHSGVNSDR